MITLRIDNSYSQITGLSAKDEKALRDLLSYVVGGKSAYFSKFGPKRRSLLDKKGFFPSGLLPRVLKHSDIGKIEDKRRLPVTGHFHDSKGAYKWQVDAVCAAISAGRGIISAPTGTGKSRAIYQLILSLSVKTLVIVPSLEIKKQLSETLSPLANVRVENIDAKVLETLTDFDCLIIDEGHHVAAKTYHRLNKKAWNNICHRYFFSATPFRNDSEEQLLFEAIAGKVIYQLNYAEAVESKYIVPVEAYYIEMPKVAVEGYTYRQVYDECVVNNETRNLTISRLLLQLNAIEKPTLCMVREVEHGEILSTITGLPFVSGQDDESRDYIRQFNTGEIKVLIGTTGVLGEGIDTKPAEYVVIAGLGKAKSQFMQQVGRGVRTYPGKESAKIILIKDKSQKYLLRHYNAQVKIIKEEYGIKPLKLELE